MSFIDQRPVKLEFAVTTQAKSAFSKIENETAKDPKINTSNLSIKLGSDKKESSAKFKKGLKSKRRSRHEEDGRIYKCECGKSYLSDTALTNHRIVKHNYQSEKRGKGRPKKYDNTIPFSSISFFKYNEVFFTNPFRIKKDFTINIKEFCSLVSQMEEQFKDDAELTQIIADTKDKENAISGPHKPGRAKRLEIRNKNKDTNVTKEPTSKNQSEETKELQLENVSSSLITQIWLSQLFKVIFERLSKSVLANKSSRAYPLYKMMVPFINVRTLQDSEESLIEVKYSDNPQHPSTASESKFNCYTIDECFVQYLCYVTDYTNVDYFNFIILFIILFREYLNSFISVSNQKLITNTKIDYTSDRNTSAQELPSHFELFMADFLEPNNYYEIYDPEEILQIIQHFCYWLYDRGFTSLRIALVNLNS